MVATLDHPSFRQPADPAVWLWRYMDLSKFVSLLQSKALIFARADTLGDPFEGSFPDPNARAFEFFRALRIENPDKDPYKDLNDCQFTRMFEQLSAARKQAIKWHYISCWHMNEFESAGMWKLYARSGDAVCIRTDYQTLSSILPAECFLGAVDYIDFRKAVIPADNIFAPFLVKRASFAHEREARGVIAKYDSMNSGSHPPTMSIPIDINELVKEVFVSPEAAEWFKDTVSGLTDKYQLTAKVNHSSMNATPLY